MSNYSKSTNFATKDNLTPGDPLKIVRGTEIDTEYNNIATAIATKTDNASAAITGGTINDTTIGATTASTGAFTTLSASSTVTLSGGTANGVTYLNGSKVVTSGSALTFDGSSLLTSRTTDGLIFTARGTSNAQLLLSVNSGVLQYDSSNGSAVHAFLTNNAEQMRLTSTGLGIGTSSPAYKLDVNGNAQIGNATAGTNRFLYINGVTNKASGIAFQESGTNRWLIGNGAASENGNFEIYDATNGNNFILTRSGNLGLGVTPSAWNSGVKALQINRLGFQGNGSGGGVIVANAYYGTSAWTYINSDYATSYEQSSGQHKWFNAASGTAGNTFSFTQAMSLTAAGDLLVGTTSFSYQPTQGATIAGGSVGSIGIGHASGTSDGNGYLNFAYNGTNIGSVTQNSTTSVAYNTSSDYRLKNITGPITNSGAYIDSLNPVEGTWKADGSTFVGLIAHEVQEASRTPVATGTKDGAEMQAMDYSNSELIANLIAEVKSLRKRLADAGL